MADTGSRRVRLTLRLRLTLLYGACFLVGGAALLGITYALVAHDTSTQQESLMVEVPQFQIKASTAVGGGSVQLKAGEKLRRTFNPSKSSGSTSAVVVGGGSASGGSESLPPTIARELAKAQAQGQAQIRSIAEQANVNLKTQRAHSLSSLLTWSGVALGVMAILSILLGWLLAGRALRPLRTMNRRAREITEESLHERLGVEQRADELGELAASFDGLLARLERAFDSQRQFVANASHELRTPVTLSRTLVEVALADPQVSPESLRHACERVLASTEQQERLIEALLTLARGQAGIETGQSVDLAEIVADVLLSREARLEGLKLESDLKAAPVVGDAALLERLIANLVDNAALHNAGEDRWVQVETGERDSRGWLRIANSGEPIPPTRVDELFEPFRRIDGDRTAGDQGLGLGLSIVQAIANAHAAELVARAPEEGGLEIELRFSVVGPGLYPETDDGSHQRVLAGTDRTG